MQHLHRLGHRKIGVPISPSVYEKPWNPIWMDHRIKLLYACAKSLSVNMKIYTAKKSFSLQHANQINPTAHKGFQTIPLPISIYDHYIADNISGLLYLLRQKGVSAIVALNDDAARHYSIWCAGSRISIPQEFSLVSFDNSRYAEALNITSADFRLDFTGHEAGELFINPTRASKRKFKVIAAEPMLIVRGSSGEVG